MKLLISAVLFCLVTTYTTAQKPSKESVQVYQHRLPSQYLPDNYSSYSVDFSLNGGEKKVYVDGEFVRNSLPLRFMEFWKKEDVLANFATLQFLSYEIDSSIKKEDKILFKVDVSDARVNAKIKEDLDAVLPYTYEYSWSVSVTTTALNSQTGEELHNIKRTYGNKHRPSSNKDGYKNGFKTYKEAKAYVSKDADKNLIANEFYKNLGLKDAMRDSYEITFFLQDPMPFWSVSKEKKFPQAATLNTTVKETVKNIKDLNAALRKRSSKNYHEKIKKLMRDRRTLGFKFSNDTIGLGYRKKMDVLLENIVTESDKLIPTLDASDKKQKGILWGMLMNKGTAAYVTAKYDTARAIALEAKALDYKSSRTDNLIRAIDYASKNYEQLKLGKTSKGVAMNPAYLQFRTE